MDFIDKSNLLDLFSWDGWDNCTLSTIHLDSILQKTSSQTSTLTNLCCAKIIRYAKLLNIDHISFPSNLYNQLMLEALRQDRPNYAAYLMSTWPTKIISVISVVPYPKGACENETRGYGITMSKALADYNLKNAMKAVLCVIRLFLEVVTRLLPPQLRVLDLSGWVLSDKMMYYLLREIFELPSYLTPLDIYHIVLECEILKSTTYVVLMFFLKQIGEPLGKKIQLHFKKLVLGYLSRDKFWDLFQLINPTELVALAMPYFENDFMEKIFIKIPSLVALKLKEECDCSDTHMLPLQLLPRLRRLQFSNLANRIPDLVVRELEHLNVSYVMDYDKVEDVFQFITSAPFRLRELVVETEALLTNILYLWRDLFRSLAPTLRLLKLHTFYVEDLSSIVDCILLLDNLVFLDLYGTVIHWALCMENIPKLGSMQHLRKIVTSVPFMHIDEDIVGDHESHLKSTREAIEREMANKKLIPTEIEWFKF